jgi:hypothetical protein
MKMSTTQHLMMLSGVSINWWLESVGRDEEKCEENERLRIDTNST